MTMLELPIIIHYFVKIKNNPICEECFLTKRSISHASHKDEFGKKNKLCSKHAKEFSTYILRYPCLLCLKEK